MKTWKRFVLPGLCALLLLSIAAPVFAAPDDIKIPPLREWPIIGTIIRIVERIIKKAPEPVEPGATIEPDLREIPIETREDILALRDLEPNERVRITATDAALVNIINNTIPGDFKEMIEPTVTFTKGKAIITADVDPKVLDSFDVDIPISVDDGLFGEVTLSFGATACRATVTVEYVAVNNFSIGLKKLAQDWLDTEIPGMWPEEVCVEYIVIEPGQFNAVGYRK